MDAVDTSVKQIFPLFESDLLDEINAQGMIKSFAENIQVMEVGESLAHFPLVLNGALKVFSENKNGEELLLYYLESGDSCAVSLKCCAGAAKSQVSAITETPTTLVLIPTAFMEKWMAKYPTWRSFVLNIFSDRFDELLDAVDGLAFQNLEQRIKLYLTDKSLILKTNELPITHAEMASELNTSRVVISRLMKKLEASSFISQSRNMVVLKA